jgi:hypothetical protein
MLAYVKHVQNLFDGINICYCIAIEKLFRSIFAELGISAGEQRGNRGGMTTHGAAMYGIIP